VTTDRPPATSRSRRICVLWVTALTLLLTLGLFCWLVVVPVRQVASIVQSCGPASHTQLSLDTNDYGAAVNQLGGPDAAVEKLGAYLRRPRRLAPQKWIAVRMLGACGSTAVPELLCLIREEEEREGTPTWLSMFAVESLATIGDVRGLSPLLRLSGHKSHNVQAKALRALTRFRDPRTVKPLIEALRSKDESVRRPATKGLKKIAGPEWASVVDAMLDPQRGMTLKKIPDERLSDPQLREFLLQLLEFEGGRLSFVAAMELGEMKEQRAVDTLIKLMNTVDEFNMYHVVWALGELGDRRAVPTLTLALKNDDKEVRQAAAEALKKIKAAESAKDQK
jgi:HEAT repeat protein